MQEMLAIVKGRKYEEILTKFRCCRFRCAIEDIKSSETR